MRRYHHIGIPTTIPRAGEVYQIRSFDHDDNVHVRLCKGSGG